MRSVGYTDTAHLKVFLIFSLKKSEKIFTLIHGNYTNQKVNFLLSRKNVIFSVNIAHTDIVNNSLLSILSKSGKYIYKRDGRERALDRLKTKRIWQIRFVRVAQHRDNVTHRARLSARGWCGVCHLFGLTRACTQLSSVRAVTTPLGVNWDKEANKLCNTHIHTRHHFHPETGHTILFSSFLRFLPSSMGYLYGAKDRIISSLTCGHKTKTQEGRLSPPTPLTNAWCVDDPCAWKNHVIDLSRFRQSSGGGGLITLINPTTAPQTRKMLPKMKFQFIHNLLFFFIWKWKNIIILKASSEYYKLRVRLQRICNESIQIMELR